MLVHSKYLLYLISYGTECPLIKVIILIKCGEDLSVGDSSFLDDCGNYAQCLTPVLLPAVNPARISVLDHFYRSQFNLHRESGNECYKESERVERSSRN